MIASALALLIMQVGPNPSVGTTPGIPEELRDRPPRERTAENRTAVPAKPGNLARCLSLAGSEPQQAQDFAQGWRELAESDLDLAQSSHCLGLAMITMGNFAEAQQVFEMARSEVPDGNPAYQARLSAMAGNAALANGDAAAAEVAFATAMQYAANAEDGPLTAGLSIDRARALVALDRTHEAVEALALARTSDPANARAWLLSATLSRRLERLGEAQRQIEQAARLAPQDPEVGLEAGVIAALSGREIDARQSFESVLLVAPDSDEATKARGYLEQLKP